MNKWITYCFILLYSFSISLPFKAVLEYHFNKQYISTRLCENIDKPAMHCEGKCYLVKQMKDEMQKEKEQNNTQGKLPVMQFSFEHLLLKQSELNPASFQLPAFYYSRTHTYSFDYLAEVFSPPDFV